MADSRRARLVCRPDREESLYHIERTMFLSIVSYNYINDYYCKPYDVIMWYVEFLTGRPLFNREILIYTLDLSIICKNALFTPKFEVCVTSMTET